MSAAETALPETRPGRAAARRAAARQSKSERRARIRQENAEKLEQHDEAIAPAIQRLGTSTKNPRLMRDGISFRVASPIAVMVAMGKKRERAGGEPTIGKAHQRAADRLVSAWEVSQTITIGTGKYGEAVSGSVNAGVLSQTVIANVNRQQDALAEVMAARQMLGSVWAVVEAVALKGQDCKAWAESRRGPDGKPAPMDRQVTYGYLRAGLDLLVDFYRLRDGARIPKTLHMEHGAPTP